jgi:hypothetical protein
MILFSYIIIAVALFAIYQEVPVEIFKSFGLAMLYSAAVLSLTFLFSSFSKGAMGATVITLVFIWIVSGIVVSVLAATNNPNWFMISAQGNSLLVVYGAFAGLLAGNSGGGPGINGITDYSIPLAILGMFIYMVVGFAVAIRIAGRRQLA